MRRQNREKKLKSKNNLFIYLILLGIIFIVGGFLFVWFKVSKLEKFTYIEKTGDNGAFVTVVDSKTDNLIRYKINPDTLLKSARGLGEYKLESLWVLGEKEGYGGKLVSESILGNYLIPVHLWKNDNKSNLSIYQKIKVFLASKQNVKEEKILAETDLSNSILINFLNNKIQESEIRVYVDDMTGDPEVIRKVSSVIGTLGTKISGYNKGYDENLDCELLGNKSEILKVFSDVFGCKVTTQTDSDEVKIKLGARFADRF